MLDTTSEKTKINQEYLNDLLQRIKQRPGMYLGQASITRLRMLLMGYSMARGELGLPLTEQEKQFAQFQKWIQQKYEINTTQGWDSIILSQVKDEKLALDLFFDLLQEFHLAKGNYLLQKDKLFEGETVDSLYEKIKALEDEEKIESSNETLSKDHD
jgi:hypothetical protein